MCKISMEEIILLLRDILKDQNGKKVTLYLWRQYFTDINIIKIDLYIPYNCILKSV